MKGVWVFGVLLALVGNGLSALGMNLQRYSHTHQQDRSLFRRPAYVLGLICFALTEVFNFVALSFTPPSVISPLSTFNILCTTVFGRFLFGEEVGPGTARGLVFLIIGSVMNVVFGPKSANDLDVEEFTKQLSTGSSKGYILGCMLVIAVAGIGFRTSVYGLVLAASVSAGNTITLTKALAVFVKLSITSTNQMGKLIPYIVLVFVGISVGIQLFFINKAMEKAPSHIVNALYSVLMNISVMAASSVLFQGDGQMTPMRIGMTGIGILLSIYGLIKICNGKEEEEKGGKSDIEPLIVRDKS